MNTHTSALWGKHGTVLNLECYICIHVPQGLREQFHSRSFLCINLTVMIWLEKFRKLGGSLQGKLCTEREILAIEENLLSFLYSMICENVDSLPRK